MRFAPTSLPGVHIIEPSPHVDRRGFFARLYEARAFADAGIDFTPADVNLSRNPTAGTLRGLHFQDPPFAEAKIVRVTRGRVFDVIVDLRPGPTLGRWTAVELDAGLANAVFIPEGCAHGFLTLEPDTDVLYHMGRPYQPGQSRGFRYDDPAFAIDWPTAPTLIGDADLAWPAFVG
ncbi:MAG: dTDP-4-dehydrorhamnose 3,5-epimerase family protein [Hyphomicrobiaceae bacterium]|nr:dTDP-4-dehydrorhamnose 3,5-epimerase family protein [Hyphomicrobiaceae bacterium]